MIELHYRIWQWLHRNVTGETSGVGQAFAEFFYDALLLLVLVAVMGLVVGSVL